MLYFSNAKINLGLNITEKRPDGFHNIETAFYPIAIKDALEFVPSNEVQLTSSGIEIDCSLDDNLIIKAYKILEQEFNLPPLAFHIHKTTPFGAGLGGGSANAAQTLIALNQHFKLNITEDKLLEYASRLGSDCAFFIKNKATLAKGKGDIFEKLSLDLSQYYILLIHPDFGISTPKAYAKVKPKTADKSISEIILQDISTWESELKNDFEAALFDDYPVLNEIKQKLYQEGAIYASMSGSGSSLFGIFKKEVDTKAFEAYWHWQGQML